MQTKTSEELCMSQLLNIQSMAHSTTCYAHKSNISNTFP